ncbi:stage III sporulation protein AE [Brevibacillus centrosporus]|uniref:Stage III sporulation protein AE n=1 Tax=Brevibacillus centrosporus TaxID=54910 RepID=A0A1I3U4D1_9BACL|nr:stage III sporulation protein AE [Brevibacillus centrosporus]MEC2132616.1 stage III sporulation protein AE [Brevibacillus centrosporus]MED1950734.1 stage III sporulation protein AE [Brevibacillus centrosporus]MED4908714.1 stage III sporulation protein AE [Brevibacillus centrosporus]RNB69640.1 stage III sporulation protein AE [Brevibacillus centrosporus]SFJ77755.1 stage III sporulation protein AE [Brevibacillus centrosporus]
MVRTGKIIVLFLLFLFVPFEGASAEGTTTSGPINQMVQEQVDHLQLERVEQYWQQLQREYKGYLPDLQSPGFIQLLMQQGELSISGVLKGMGKFVFHEILMNGKLLSSIIIITVFAMILETMQNAFERNAVSTVAYSIAYLVLMVLAINSFHVAISYAKDAITDMSDFMLAMIPLVIALLASVGNLATATMFHPLIIFMINISGMMISYVVFPLLFLSAMLSIVSLFSERYKVTQLATLLRNIAMGVLGSFLTIFLAVISIQGATSAVTDGVTLRTAKYITGNFIPIVGRVFSDAADTVLNASLLVKNAVGLAGVVILIMLCAFPALKILVLALIYNLSSAVLQPLGNSPIISALGTIGKSLLFVFAALATVGLMFFLAITIIIAAGNISMMVR